MSSPADMYNHRYIRQLGGSLSWPILYPHSRLRLHPLSRYLPIMSSPDIYHHRYIRQLGGSLSWQILHRHSRLRLHPSQQISTYHVITYRHV